VSELRIEKIVDGDVVCLKLEGAIDERFDGKKVAEGVTARALVLELSEVKRISSFGIREWVDFVDAVGARVGSLTLVDCSPKVVDQLNMVANFAGRGRVWSVLAPYRCDYCDADRRVLLVADRDAEIIRRMRPQDHPCATCGNVEYFDEDPQSFFSVLAQQPAFELEPEVAHFLSTHLSHAVDASVRRLKVDKQVFGRITHLRLSGDVTAQLPADKIAEGLEGTAILELSGLGQIDPAGAAAWRALMNAVNAACERVYLVGAPAGFLDRLGRPEDRGKAHVVSLALPYACAKCALTAAQPVDVDEHLGELNKGEPPARKCKECSGPTTCDASASLRAVLAQLGASGADAEVRKAIKQAREQKPMHAPQAAASSSRGGGLFLLAGAAAAALVAVGLVAGKTYLDQRRGASHVAAAKESVGPLVSRSEAARPAWVVSDARGFAACVAAGTAISCHGVSTYASDKDQARQEARDAALEALSARVALAIDQPAFRAVVLELYEPARQLALRQLEDEAGWQRAQKEVTDRRRAVAEALGKTGGTAVPAQTAGEYLEEYGAPGEASSRHLAFVRVSATDEQVQALASRYGKPVEVLGARLLTFFPGAAWRFPAVTEGAFVLTVAPGPLRDIGLAPQDVVLELQGKQVHDAEAFALELRREWERTEALGGSIRMTVKSGDGAPRVYSLNVPRKPAPDEGTAPRANRDPRGGQSGGASGINVWDRTGGGAVADDPNQ
jgi:anti-anti-sigma regulatory factor